MAFLLSGIALAFQGPQCVFFYFTIKLQFEVLVVSEVSHGAHRDEVDLLEAIGNELLFVIVRALQRVVIRGSILDEAARHYR